jgi:hypothetical protein
MKGALTSAAWTVQDAVYGSRQGTGLTPVAAAVDVVARAILDDTGASRALSPGVVRAERPWFRDLGPLPTPVPQEQP